MRVQQFHFSRFAGGTMIFRHSSGLVLSGQIGQIDLLGIIGDRVMMVQLARPPLRSPDDSPSGVDTVRYGYPLAGSSLYGLNRLDNIVVVDASSQRLRAVLVPSNAPVDLAKDAFANPWSTALLAA